MTIAEHFIQKGEARGEARGIERGALERTHQIALNMLNAGMDKSAIAEMTQLSLEEIEKIAPAKH